MNILITGGSGFLGARPLLRELANLATRALITIPGLEPFLRARAASVAECVQPDPWAAPSA